MSPIYKVHIGYILFLLIGTIVALVTVKWTTIPQLVEYLSFALTLTSLALAVLAIVYAFYSNQSFSQNLSTLTTSAQQISTASTTITTATADLGRKVESLPLLIEGVGRRVEETHGLLREVSQRPQVSQAQVPISNPERDGTFPNSVAFLNTASTLGIFALYAASLASARRVPFHLVELCKALKFPEPDYWNGFLLAVSSFGGFSYRVHNDIWTVDGFNAELASRVSETLDARLTATINPEDPAMKKFLQDAKATIDHWFIRP